MKCDMSIVTCKRVFLFTQVTKMKRRSLVFVSQPRVFFQPIQLKIAAFVRRFCHFRIRITIAFSFFNPQVVLIFVFFSFFISFAAKIAVDFLLRHFVKRSQKVCTSCPKISQT